MRCPECMGRKFVEGDEGKMMACPECNGMGETIEVIDPLFICNCTRCKQQNACDCQLTKCEICNKQLLKCNSKVSAGNIIACPQCFDKEAELQVAAAKEAEQRIVEADPRYKFHLEVDRDLGLIEGNEFEKAIQIKSRIDDLGQKLFEVQTKRNRYYQNFIELTKTLRAEERLKLGLSSDYKPYTPKPVEPKPKAERRSKEDKSYTFMVNTFFGKKLLKLDEVNKECYKDHPDWWSNGVVKPEHIRVYEEYVDSKGAVTQNMALERVKDMVSGSRAKALTQYATGERKLSE